MIEFGIIVFILGSTLFQIALIRANTQDIRADLRSIRRQLETD